MTYIKFNVMALRGTANAIDEYLSKIDGFMMSANLQTHFYLNTVWAGPDYDAFINQWEKTNDEQTSTTKQMIRDLKAYADYLRLAAKLYENAIICITDKGEDLPY